MDNLLATLKNAVFVLEEDSMMNASLVTERLIEVFPNIAYVNSDAHAFRGTGCEFASKWVNVLGNQLVEFHSYMPFGRAVTQLPLESTAVTFSCGTHFDDLLVKINSFLPA